MIIFDAFLIPISVGVGGTIDSYINSYLVKNKIIVIKNSNNSSIPYSFNDNKIFLYRLYENTLRAAKFYAIPYGIFISFSLFVSSILKIDKDIVFSNITHSGIQSISILSILQSIYCTIYFICGNQGTELLSAIRTPRVFGRARLAPCEARDDEVIRTIEYEENKIMNEEDKIMNEEDDSSVNSEENTFENKISSDNYEDDTVDILGKIIVKQSIKYAICGMIIGGIIYTAKFFSEITKGED